MKALSLASTTLEKKRLGTKCQSLLDLGERIKQAEDINPIVRDYARGSDSLIERTARTAQDVISTRKMTTRERILILESSKLNGFIFPPWQDTPCVEDFHLDEDQEPFMYVVMSPVNISNRRNNVTCFACLMIQIPTIS